MRVLHPGDYLGPGNQITRMVRTGFGWMAFAFDGAIYTQINSPAGLSVLADAPSLDPDDYILTAWPPLTDDQAANLVNTWKISARIRIPDHVEALNG